MATKSQQSRKEGVTPEIVNARRLRAKALTLGGGEGCKRYAGVVDESLERELQRQRPRNLQHSVKQVRDGKNAQVNRVARV